MSENLENFTEENTSQDQASAQETNEETNLNGETIHELKAVSGMYQNWFLDYASYVILERAVPAIEDGLKPVQRRILHAMKEIDDGRFNKVANVIGQTMQFHPHGDAAIGDAMVNLGQKELLIETQGNWGDIRTGDSAAAPRYIEARLSKFALEVAFNPQTTTWQASYDGRKREPVTLPMKFPLLLAQGVEGIAVGLATKVMPHNFIELINASIDVLRNRPINIMPDFPTGGMADFSNYNEGKKGGRIRVRAKIEEVDKRTLVVRDIPFGTTTTSLMESIVKANENGKIKIKKVIDNTAANVEIEIQLHPGTSPDITIDALYAFTECEVSISPNACVIIEDKPHFLSVNEILRLCTGNTVNLLRRELEIRKGELEDKWHYSSLEKIFIENRIYRDIEECETWEAVLQAIDKGLEPHKYLLRREVTQDDIIRLTEIKIKRISKYDSFKADEQIRALEDEMKEVMFNIENIIDYSVNYFKNLLKKYGKGRERKTEIRSFETINASVVAVANQKLYVNRKEGFIGYGLKKDEFITECSDLDDIIVFRRDGKFSVTKVSEKTFVGKDIIHADVWKKGDERMVYNVIFVDGKTGIARSKRFAVTGVTRDKVYDLTMGEPNSRVIYFSANPNSEAEIVSVQLTQNAKAIKKVFDYDFASLEIKGRGSQGNILSKHSIKKVSFKEKGASTLGGRDIWYDEILGRLNVDNRGKYLGSFDLDDTILVVYKDGSYEITGYDLTNRYEAEQIVAINKFNPQEVITALHYDANNKAHYVKRFVIETSTVGKKFSFIADGRGSKLVLATMEPHPKMKITTGNKKTGFETKEIELSEFVDVRGWKAMGNKIAENDVQSAELLEPEIAGEEIAPGTVKTKSSVSTATTKSKAEPKAVFSSDEPEVEKEPVKIAVKKADPVAAAAVEDVMESAKEELEKKAAVTYAKKKTTASKKELDIDDSQLKLF